MDKCIATTKAGKPCRNKQKYGELCGVHRKKTLNKSQKSVTKPKPKSIDLMIKFLDLPPGPIQGCDPLA